MFEYFRELVSKSLHIHANLVIAMWLHYRRVAVMFRLSQMWVFPSCIYINIGLYAEKALHSLQHHEVDTVVSSLVLSVVATENLSWVVFNQCSIPFELVFFETKSTFKQILVTFSNIAIWIAWNISEPLSPSL